MIVTLLTDFGVEDEYVGVVKGVILGVNPSATIVDISHEIPPGNISRAGWLLAWSWPYFPRGTVHLVVVDPGVGSKRRILCLEHKGHRFLAPDNGLLSQVLEGVPSPRLYGVTNRHFFLKEISRTFHGRDLFAPVAGYLSKGLSPRALGPQVGIFRRLPVSPSVPHPKGITGQVILVDRFGNAVTNISTHQIKRLTLQGALEVRLKNVVLHGIQRSYSVAEKGSPVAVIGSHGLLEVAVNQGSAKREFRLKAGDRVSIRVRGQS